MVSDGGYAGFGGGGGAGASHVNVKVVGGQYGLLFDQSEPCPVAAGVTLWNQTTAAVLYAGQQTMVIVGADIVLGRGATGAAVQPAAAAHPITLVDAVVTCGQGQAAFGNAASLFLQNVYVAPMCDLSNIGGPAAAVAAPHWQHVVELARGVDVEKSGFTMAMDLTYTNGVRTKGGTVHEVVPVVDSAAVPAGPSMVAKHTWDERSFPALETATDAVQECGAKGDGVTDDTQKLQDCLDRHAAVLLPKGRFRLSATLELRNGTQLLGLSQTLSYLMPLHTGFSGAVPGAGAPFQPLVRTAAGAPVTIAFVGMVSWWHVPVYTLDYRARGGLWRSNYETRVSECLWLNDYRNQTADPPCVAGFNITVPKTQVTGTGR